MADSELQKYFNERVKYYGSLSPMELKVYQEIRQDQQDTLDDVSKKQESLV